MRDISKSPMRVDDVTPKKKDSNKKRQRSQSAKVERRGRSEEKFKSPKKTVKRCTKSKARKTPNKSPKNKRQNTGRDVTPSRTATRGKSQSRSKRATPTKAKTPTKR